MTATQSAALPIARVVLRILIVLNWLVFAATLVLLLVGRRNRGDLNDAGGGGEPGSHLRPDDLPTSIGSANPTIGQAAQRGGGEQHRA